MHLFTRKSRFPQECAAAITDMRSRNTTLFFSSSAPDIAINQRHRQSPPRHIARKISVDAIGDGLPRYRQDTSAQYRTLGGTLFRASALAKISANPLFRRRGLTGPCRMAPPHGS
jgi:hypothetical protein